MLPKKNISKKNTQAFATVFWLSDMEKALPIFVKGNVNLNYYDEDDGFTFHRTACLPWNKYGQAVREVGLCCEEGQSAEEAIRTINNYGSF